MVLLDAHRSKSCVPSNALPSEADLQLLFARLNYEFFNGEAPDCRIRYNERFSNSAGRTTYGRHPLEIELSPKHFREYPEALTETLLHEMIHAWCYAKFRDTGHGARFKRKLRECGLQLDLPRSRQRRSAQRIEQAVHTAMRALRVRSAPARASAQAVELPALQQTSL